MGKSDPTSAMLAAVEARMRAVEQIARLVATVRRDPGAPRAAWAMQTAEALRAHLEAAGPLPGAKVAAKVSVKGSAKGGR